jgi:hypothetical protein
MEAVGPPKRFLLSTELKDVRAQRYVMIIITLMMKAGNSFETFVPIDQSKKSHLKKPSSSRSP